MSLDGAKVQITTKSAIFLGYFAMICDEQHKLESEADACGEGVITDILDVSGEIDGAFIGDELAVLLKPPVKNRRRCEGLSVCN